MVMISELHWNRSEQICVIPPSETRFHVDYERTKKKQLQPTTQLAMSFLASSIENFEQISQYSFMVFLDISFGV